jgi:hypothetical protein
MKLIKIASLEDKLNRAGNPTEPLLVQVCRLEDAKNYLNWGNIKVKNKGSLEKEINSFVSSGKAEKVLDNQIKKSKDRFKDLLVFEVDKPKKPEISTQQRNRITNYLKFIDEWKKVLFGEGNYSYKKSSPFIYTVIASNLVFNDTITPSPEFLQQMFVEISKDSSQKAIEEISSNPESKALLDSLNIEESEDTNKFMSNVQKTLKNLGTQINQSVDKLEWLVGYDPTLYDSLQIDPKKEKYKGMSFEEVKKSIYEEKKSIPEHAKEKALKGIIDKVKKYLWATPVDELSPDEKSDFEKSKASLEILKKKRSELNDLLEDLTYSRSRGENQILELSEEVYKKTETDSEIEGDFKDSLSDGWYCIPGGETVNEIKYPGIDLRNKIPDQDWGPKKNRVAFVSLVSAGTGWCINQLNMARSYVSTGDIILYVQNKTGKVCIRYRSDDSIAEFTGFNNRPINLVPYADEIFELCEEHPAIKESFEKFTPGKNHGSLKSLAEDVKGVEEHNELSPEELAERIEADIVNPKYKWKVDHEQMNEWQRRTTSDYIYDEKVEECSKSTKFVEAIKKQWFKIENNEKDSLAGRFPFLKSNDEVIDRVTELVKDEFIHIAKYGNDQDMKSINIVNICNQFGQIPLKDKEVRDWAFKAYVRLSNESELTDKQENLQEYLRVVVEQTGAYPLFQEAAQNEAVKMMVDGDMESSMKIRSMFGLEFDGELDEETFNTYFDQAVDFFINDGESFEKLNKLFGGKFGEPETLERIKKAAFPKAEDKAIDFINVFDALEDEHQDLHDLILDFPGLLKSKKVLEVAFEQSSTLFLKNPNYFKKLDQFFNGLFSKEETIKKIKEKMYPKALEDAVEFVRRIGLGHDLLDVLSELLDDFPEIFKTQRFLNKGIQVGADLIVNDLNAFERLNLIYNNELTKGHSYDGILKLALPKILNRALTQLENNKISEFYSWLERFPILKDHHQIISKAVDKTVEQLSLGKFKEASKIVKLIGFNNYDMDAIYEKVFDLLRVEIEEAMSTGDRRALYSYDLRTGRKTKKNEEGKNVVVNTGLVFGEKRQEIIDSSKDLALTHIMSRLLHIKNVPLESIENFKLINSIYNNEFKDNKMVKSRIKSVYIRNKNLNNENSQEIISAIESIYGKDLVSESDVNIDRLKMVKNYAKVAEQALESEDFTKLIKIFTKFPELKDHNGLLSVSIQFAWNCARDVHIEDYERVNEKKTNIETLNNLFNGALLASPMANQAYQKVIARERELQKEINQNLQENLNNQTENI